MSLLDLRGAFPGDISHLHAPRQVKWPCPFRSPSQTRLSGSIVFLPLSFISGVNDEFFKAPAVTRSVCFIGQSREFYRVPGDNLAETR
jgi:hypothetical protein